MPTQAHRPPDTLRSIYYALGANLAITVVKFCGAAFTGSGSLLAESLHSLADSGNQVLLLVGRKQATAPPTARHPLGHGRATYFWSFMVTLLLFSLGGLFSIYEGYEKLRAQSTVEAPWVAVSIVVIAMILEGISLRVTLQQIAGVRGDTSLFRWFRETRRGELIVVLGEDIAAIAGLSFALAALLVTITTGDALYDSVGSIGIGVLLIIVASGLAVETKSLLIGESASPRARRAIRRFFDSHRNVLRIRHLITLQQQGDEILVAVQLEMRPVPSGVRLLHAITECKSEFQAQFPQAKWIFIEPVAAADDRAAPNAARRPRSAHA
jgi:cation diffusion facilitator family transporter